MLGAIVSLLTGGVGGGLMSIATGVIGYFKHKQDNAHELEMSKLQLQIDAARSKEQIDLAHTQGDLEVQAKQMDAYITALQGQSQTSGVKWIDGLNKSVRPVLTYWWLILFTMYKVGTLVVLAHQPHTIGQFVAAMWTNRDWEIFGTIIGFWFVNRSLAKHLSS